MEYRRNSPLYNDAARADPQKLLLIKIARQKDGRE
jgi:hypothetical protein